MDQKIIEMVERLDEERLNLFLNYLQGILDSQEPIQADDQKDPINKILFIIHHIAWIAATLRTQQM